jgi:hypothetical protein
MIIMSTTGMTEFGSQGIGSIEVAPMVVKEFGFLATGNGGSDQQENLKHFKKDT